MAPLSGRFVPSQVKTYQVPITNSYPSHYIICHLPLVFISPTSPLSFYSSSLSHTPLSFACLLCARVLVHLSHRMVSPPIIVNTPDHEVLNFKQREGENLKDAWHRIGNTQNRSTRKQSPSVLLRNFYVGITP